MDCLIILLLILVGIAFVPLVFVLLISIAEGGDSAY